MLLSAEAPDQLDRVANWTGVVGYERDPGGPARVQIDGPGRVPDLVAGLVADGVRLTRVEPHNPTLEDLYFAVRRESRRRGLAPSHPASSGVAGKIGSGPMTATYDRTTRPRSATPSDRRRPRTVPRPGACSPSPAPSSSSSPRPGTTGSRWSALGGDLLPDRPGHPDADHHPDRRRARSTAQTRRRSTSFPRPPSIRSSGTSAKGRTAYAWRSSCSLRSPSSCRSPSRPWSARRRWWASASGTGEFPAHSPATAREIYLGKLLASLVPGYITTIVGFGFYSLLVDLVAGPEVGRWFFPTAKWSVLMFWVIPPFPAFTLSLVLRLSARVKSTAAAQQASGLVTLPLIIIAYSQSTGGCSVRRSRAGGWARSRG